MGSNQQLAMTGNDGYLFRLPETEPRGTSRLRRIPQVLALWFAGSFAALSREKQAKRQDSRFQCGENTLTRSPKSTRTFPNFLRAYFGSIRQNSRARALVIALK